MTNTVRFRMSKPDVIILLAELDHYVPAVLYAALQEQLLTAAATLDADSASTTEIELASEHVAPFRKWLDGAKARDAISGYPRKAEIFARVRASEY